MVVVLGEDDPGITYPVSIVRSQVRNSRKLEERFRQPKQEAAERQQLRAVAGHHLAVCGILLR